TSGPGSSTAPTLYRLSGRALMQTELFAGGGVDVRPIAHARGLTEIAFALPGSSVWYRMWIDNRFRLRRESIVDPGHLIRRTFSYPRTGASPSSPRRTSSVTPPPPGNSFAIAREDDDLAVALAAQSVGRRLKLTATVITGSGDGAGGLDIRFDVVSASGGTATIGAQPCGLGCYRASPILRGKPQKVRVEIGRLGQQPRTLAFPFPKQWPAPSAIQLVRRATSVFRHLRSYATNERLARNAHEAVHTHWEWVAPNRMAYQIAGLSDAVVIG